MKKTLMFLVLFGLCFKSAMAGMVITATPTSTPTDVPTEVAVNYVSNSQCVTFQQALSNTPGLSFNMSRGTNFAASVNWPSAPNLSMGITYDLEYSLDGISWSSFGNSGPVTGNAQFQAQGPIVGHFVRFSFMGVSPTQTLTSTPTPTITNTFTITNTPVFTNTITITPTWNKTTSPTIVATNATGTLTFTPSYTITPTLTSTPTWTITNTPTSTWTIIPYVANVKLKVMPGGGNPPFSTFTSIPTATGSATPTPTNTSTITPTLTPNIGVNPGVKVVQTVFVPQSVNATIVLTPPTDPSTGRPFVPTNLTGVMVTSYGVGANTCSVFLESSFPGTTIAQTGTAFATIGSGGGQYGAVNSIVNASAGQAVFTGAPQYVLAVTTFVPTTSPTPNFTPVILLEWSKP